MARAQGIDKCAEPIDAWGFPIRGYVAPPATVHVPQRGKGSLGYNRVLEGLRSLARRQAPGETFTHDAIATECGCSEHNIREIEKRAKKKLRGRLERDPAFADIARRFAENNLAII